MKYFYVLILIFYTTSLKAQLKLVEEISFLLPDNLLEEIEVFPIDQQHFIYINHQSVKFKKSNNLVLKRIDENLNVLWENVIPIEYKLIDKDIYLNNENLYVLYKQENNKKHTLFEVDLESGNWKSFNFESLTLLILTQFTVLNNQLILQGEFNSKSVIEMHDLTTKTTRVLPDIFKKKTSVNNHFVNPYHNEIYVFVENNKCELDLQVYDLEGKFLYKKKLGDKNYRILSYEIYFFNNGEPMIIGTYSNSCKGLSLGFFSGSLNISTQWTYYPFSNFESFKKTLNDKKLARLERRFHDGKGNNLGFKTNFYTLFTKKTNILLLAETYQLDNKSQMRSNSNYVNYIKDKAFVLEINSDQEGLSDHLLNLNSVNSHDLKPSIGLLKTDSSYLGVYIEDDFLYVTNSFFTKSKPEKVRFFDKNTRQISSPKFKIISSDGEIVYVGGTSIVNSNVQQNYQSEEYYIIRKYSL